MQADRLAAWVEAFALFSEVPKWSELTPTNSRLLVWDAALEDLTADQIREGARKLVSEFTYGVPAPGDLRAMVTPKRVRVPVHTLDPWGRRILNGNGYALAGFVEVEDSDPPPYLTETAARNMGLQVEREALPEGRKELAE